MKKKLFKLGIVAISAILLSACDVGSKASSTNNINSTVSTASEPQYQVSFEIPAIESGGTGSVIIRFYQPFGDGDITTGWQQTVPAPTVTLNGETLDTKEQFSYTQNFNTGALLGGTDEYAQYFMANLPTTNESGEITITGTYTQAAYISATVYYKSDDSVLKSWQLETLDYDFTTLNNIANPYIVGNPSVFAYTTNTDNTMTDVGLNSGQYLNLKTTLTHGEAIGLTSLNLPKTNTSESGQVGLYRIDKYTSNMGLVDDIASDGCSQSYLAAELTESDTQQVAVLRIKVPTTFISTNNPDKIFGNYQAQYFSVSANVNNSHKTNPLGFWTVNARMMEQYKDSKGYAYVFFAPNDYVEEIAKSQNLPTTQPPVITWGNYTGYLLGYPDFGIILRYKASNPSWQGSPINAKCYLTHLQAQPVTYSELGEYTPEIFADTLTNFESGTIGTVNKSKSWPIE